MKCPKCGYLGFEHVERCRHCGYDFSLTTSTPALELALGPVDAEAESRLFDDLALVDASSPDPRHAPDPDRRVTPELPLFGSSVADDEPLITRPSPPRPPLAVRRSTPEIPRLRHETPRLQTMDLDLEPSAANLASATPSDATLDERQTNDASGSASAGARLVAVVIDLLILAAVDGLVIYFTMQICGVTFPEIGVLPVRPLLAFLLVQNGGYLVIFTAGGQTLGKMAVGIKVVTADAPSSIDIGRACLRELLWLLLAVPAGLGFLTIFGRDRRGLHDRLAGTRVVR